MLIFKKLIFAPFFLLALALLIHQLNPTIKSYDFIFSLSWNSLIQFVTLTFLIILSSFLFVLFANLAYDWKLILPVSLVASLLPIVLINPALGLILAVGILSALLLTYFSVENTLKNYLNFEPNSLFGPHIKRLATLLILIISLTYFLSISQVTQKKSFEIPDSLIETSLSLIPQPQSEKYESKPKQTLPAIPPEQLELLKQNPDLLTETVKQTIKDQLQNTIKPYLGIIPVVLAVLLFFILLSFASILNFLIYPLLWIIFYILEKTGFIKFTTEMREVKKLVV